MKDWWWVPSTGPLLYFIGGVCEDVDLTVMHLSLIQLR